MLMWISAQVRNEIAVLKKISSGHKNIVTLHDYFEVRSNCRPTYCAVLSTAHKTDIT